MGKVEVDAMAKRQGTCGPNGDSPRAVPVWRGAGGAT